MLKKKFYILFVSRDEDGTLSKIPIPIHYAYLFLVAAAIGLFTVTGLAGSYSRMLIKTTRFNELRRNNESLKKDYANLEKQAHAKDVQAASLGSLATEVSALYGLTASRLTGKGRAGIGTPLATATSTMTDESYYKSVDTFYELRANAMNGRVVRAVPAVISTGAGIERLGNRFGLGVGVGADLTRDALLDGPSLWPVLGPITSGFGQREDPVLGTGEGEFHKGIDISAVDGTPIRATADATVVSAEMVNGYGREVVLDHGHGVETCYGHMSGFAVVSGQQVTRGQVIGYVGHSGRVTGSHLHYEVRIHNTPVNPHKYLRTTLADEAIAVGGM